MRLDWLDTPVFFQYLAGAGISRDRLTRAPVTLRLRRGGERLRLSPHGPARTLKNLLQEKNIPPWQRERWPLLYCGEELVCAPGLGIDAAYQAKASEPGLQLSFLPQGMAF